MSLFRQKPPIPPTHQEEEDYPTLSTNVTSLRTQERFHPQERLSLFQEQEWEEEEEEWEEEKSSSLRFILILSALVLLGAVGWFLYRWITAPQSQTPPFIQAEQEPYKVRPEHPGGMVVPHQDKMIYNRLSEEALPVEEHFLPDPEQPLEATPPTQMEDQQTYDQQWQEEPYPAASSRRRDPSAYQDPPPSRSYEEAPPTNDYNDRRVYYTSPAETYTDRGERDSKRAAPYSSQPPYPPRSSENSQRYEDQTEFDQILAEELREAEEQRQRMRKSPSRASLPRSSYRYEQRDAAPSYNRLPEGYQRRPSSPYSQAYEGREECPSPGHLPEERSPQGPSGQLPRSSGLPSNTYRLQLATLESKEEALEEWERLQQAQPELVQRVAGSIQKVGSYYRILIGPFKTSQEAKKFQAALEDKKIGSLLIAPAD